MPPDSSAFTQPQSHACWLVRAPAKVQKVPTAERECGVDATVAVSRPAFLIMSESDLGVRLVLKQIQ